MITFETNQCSDVAEILYNGFFIGTLTKTKKGDYVYTIDGREQVVQWKYRRFLQLIIKTDYEAGTRIRKEIERKPFTLSFKQLIKK